ncbi:hypothetical protein H310_10877 [Aphanomyces invadans]|uniref:Uncharacterized protein n=1 Tax=Aphanomyces invadans TaxID=157072 RepID=A0A024TP86_9STRA|nr:hypothetical protein H310_10877 [Aphanomyces invadans]ETV95833.1 hypothetical protein H310_10877 [Aphanomyces invadans]|eukprot:XP_008875584.1 hypothetical protein H310_10877 [Aphanomyces invadans]
MASKNIVFVSVGTRGDVQPLCIVGQALAAQGHTVSVASDRRLESLITHEFGLAFRPLEGDFCGLLFHDDFHDRFRKANVVQLIGLMEEWSSRSDKAAVLASYVPALQGADIIVSGPLCADESYAVAESLNATWVPLFFGGFNLPTTAYPHGMMQAFVGSWFGAVNKWTHYFIWSKLWGGKRDHINAWRTQQLKLAPVTSAYGVLDALLTNDSIVQLQACSLLFSGPQHEIPTDYAPGKVAYAGFVFPIMAQPEPEPLKAFLVANSTPVIYIGFGSMPTLKPRELLQFAIDVSKIAGCRAVLAAGWSSLDQESSKDLADAHADTVYIETGSISHTWLFPQMSCLVHHAGLGTIGAALRSGIPQLPCPVGIDQFYNASVLVQLGVAPCTVSKKQFVSAKYVGSAVHKVLRNDKDIQGKARDLGLFVSKESADAVPRLCALILDAKPTFSTA